MWDIQLFNAEHFKLLYMRCPISLASTGVKKRETPVKQKCLFTVEMYGFIVPCSEASWSVKIQ